MQKFFNSWSQIANHVQWLEEQAEHHGQNVLHVIPMLHKAVKARLNSPQDVRVSDFVNGNKGRRCWVTINGKDYVFRYSRPKKKIELLEGSAKGDPIDDFDNSLTQAKVNKIINSL